MVTLEMVLDPSGIQRGAADGARAIDSLGRSAKDASAVLDGMRFKLSGGGVFAPLDALKDIEKSATGAVRGLGNLSNAFQSVGGSLQVGQGITQTLAALERADVAGAGTNVARTLLEISKTGQDFRQLASGVGATGGAFTALRAVMTAHPILTIATAIGLASTAIGLFTSKTKESVDEVAKLGQGLERIRAQQSIGIDFGDPDFSRRGRRDEIEALRSAAIDIRAGRRSTTAGGLVDLLGPGVSLQDLLEGQDPQSTLRDDPRLLLNPSLNRSPDRQIGASTAVEAIRRRILFLESELRLNQPSVGDQAYDRAFAAYQRGAPQPNLDAIGGDRSPLTQYGPTEQDFQAEMARRESEIDAFNEQLQELRDIGSQVGATFASAFESVVSGANSARDAVAGLAKSLGSSVLQQVFRNLGANIAGSFARDGGPSATVRTPGVN